MSKAKGWAWLGLLSVAVVWCSAAGVWSRRDFWQNLAEGSALTLAACAVAGCTAEAVEAVRRPKG